MLFIRAGAALVMVFSGVLAELGTSEFPAGAAEIQTIADDSNAAGKSGIYSVDISSVTMWVPVNHA